MIKSKLIICLLCFVNLSLFAQTEDERKKIVESYDFDKINTLKVKLKNEFLLRESRIENYLSQNQEKQKYKSNGKTYTIYDIVDGKPIYLSTDNVQSAKTSRADKLHTGGSLGLTLDGENMIIGIWDIDHPRGTHNEFLDNQTVPQSRVTYPDLVHISLLKISDHATHVGGTLAGNGTDPLAKGMAPKASLFAFNAPNDEAEAIDEAANGLLISNHSYGVPIFNDGGSQQLNAEEIGAYTEDARKWDEIAFAAPYFLAVNSAGNEGDKNYVGGMGNGYDKLTRNKTAKNNLVVASTLPVFSSGELINYLKNGFSSQGPTDDYRIKPDIAGDGDAVYSAWSDSDSEYGVFQGTSMASPNVAGSLLLLQEYYNLLNASFMRAATLKGLACHTATDNNVKVGPDPFFGWGLLNVADAAIAIKEASDGVAVISELNLYNNDTYTYQFSTSGGGSISATICWTDPFGIVQSNSLNDPTPRLVNDLDLRLEGPNTTTFMPWKLDKTNVTASAIKGDNDVDNIEKIDISSPEAGNYTLTISHKGVLTNGVQAYSLILTGANLTLGVADKLVSNVSVWPNPTDKKLNLSFESSGNKANISLYDIHGREVYNKNIETISSKVNHSIDTKAFYSGIYFLNIQNGSSIFNKKIIIE